MSSENRFDLTGEVAVVLGGTGGLGGAMAEGLAQAGAQVAILGRSQERGEAKAKEYSKHAKTIFVSVDALDPKSLQHAEQKIEKELGPIRFWLTRLGETNRRQ
jgi:NAD(P)-dependent dehydrogenase (short-subunit alcohol dehydrogenase family)